MASGVNQKNGQGHLRTFGTMAAAVLCSALLSVSLGLGTAWADQGAAAGSTTGTEQGTAGSAGSGSASGSTGGATGSGSASGSESGNQGGTSGGNQGGTSGGSGTVTPTPKPSGKVALDSKQVKVSLSATSYTYDGKAKKPTVTVYVDGKKLSNTKNANYTVTYSSNTKPTTKAKVTVKANSKSSKVKGSKVVYFTINKAKAQSVFKVSLSTTKYTYNGKAKKPGVKVTAKVNGKTVTLKNKRDYTVSYKNNTAAGTASVVVTGKGNYTGSTTRTFTIKKAAVKSSNAAMSKKANGYASSTKYLILINSKSHKVGIYKGSKGNWSEVKYWTCTTGAPSTPTKKGVFTVGSKGTHFGESHGYTCWYYTQFSGNYLFHSVLYYPNSKTKIKSGVLGASASHGCVRLAKTNAKWIYDNIPRGTKVVSY